MNRFLTYIRFVKRAISNSANQEATVMYQIGYAVKRNSIETSALNSDIMGVNTELNEEEKPIIVSLTTHGQRIFNVYKAIESIFQQTHQANKVILYLGDAEFQGKELPELLKKQMKRGLEIRYVKDIRAYTKLVPAIREFPDSVIITIDDDYMYPIDTLEKLVMANKLYPNSVACFASRKLKLDSNGSLKPYSSYPQIFTDEYKHDISYMAEGFGAVLYPPHCMHEDVTKDDIFMKLSPLADDLWYKCMQLLVDTKVVQLPRNRSWFSTMFSDETVQNIALANQNVAENKNDPQLKAIFDYYNLYGKLK